MWSVVIISVLISGHSAQYWDMEGITLPEATAKSPYALGLGLTKSILTEPYDQLVPDRNKRMSPDVDGWTSPSSTGLPGDHQLSLGRKHGTDMAAVGKCCPLGQNLSEMADEDGSRKCAPSALPFQPIFFDFNATGMWHYDVNEWSILVGNPCSYGRYVLDPNKYAEDKFYLLTNGSLIVPLHEPTLLQPKDFCMETFWNPEFRGEPEVLPLVCFTSPPQTPTIPQSSWDIFIASVMLLSVPFLLVTSITHCCLPEVWELSGKRHCKALGAHTTFLALAFFSLAVTQLVSPHLPHTLCVVAAYSIQYSFLACFFWLNILCVDIYLNVKTDVTREEANREHYLCCGWENTLRSLWDRGWYLWGCGAPSVITLITLLLDRSPGLPVTLHKPNFGADACWFQSDASTWFYFYGPVSVLLVVNGLLFVATTRSLSRQDVTLNPLASLGRHRLPSTDPDEVLGGTSGRQRWAKYKRIFRMCCLLFLVMGISWTLEVLSWKIGGVSSIWYFSDSFNALQGIIIFLIFMTRPPVVAILWRRITKIFPCLPHYTGDDDAVEVVNERTSIACNGTTGLQPAPV